METTKRPADEQEVVDAARALLRNLTRVFGRSLHGHDLPTTHAAVRLRMALEAVDAHEPKP